MRLTDESLSRWVAARQQRWATEGPRTIEAWWNRGYVWFSEIATRSTRLGRRDAQ